MIDHNAERAVIGAAMLKPELIAEAGIAHVDFHHEPHGRAWLSIQRLNQDQKPVDPVSVASDSEVDLDYLADILSQTPTAQNIGYYGRLVRMAAITREIKQICSKGAHGDLEGEELLSDLMRSLAGVRTTVDTRGELLGDGIQRMIEHIEQNFQSKGSKKIRGIRTGLIDLDGAIVGWPKGNMSIVAARPSQGKSSTVAYCAKHAAIDGFKVDYYSLEDTKESLYARLIAQESVVDLRKILHEDLSFDQLQETQRAYRFLKDNAGDMLVYDHIPKDIAELRNVIERNAAKRETDLVVVDYLQKIRNPGFSRRSKNDEITDISNQLCEIARSTNTALIAVSQLSRAAEGVTPRLSHLRESGSLEQDAQIVCFLQRIELSDAEGEGMMCHVEKNKNGPLARVKLRWRPQFVLPGDATECQKERIREEWKKKDKSQTSWKK